MRKLLYLFLGLFVLAGAGLGAASWWVMHQLKPETWVELMETNWNCRAEVADASLSLFTQPATLTFTGVRLAPRDLEVARPLAERQPMADGQPVVEIPKLTLSVKLDDLMNRRLFVEHLLISEPVVQEQQDAEGNSSLEALFKKPGTQEAVAAAPKNEAAPAQVESKASKDEVPFFTYALSSATLEKGTVRVVSGTTEVQIENLNFQVTGVDVDRNDLAGHNRIQAGLDAHIRVTGDAKINGVKQRTELASLILSGKGDIRPISPKTLEWAPLSQLTLTLAKGSTLAGHMTIGEAAGKDLRKLQEYGVDLAPVVIGGPLMENAVVTGDFVNDRFTTRALTRFVFPEYDVAIEPKSWVNASQDKHEIELRLSTGPELQARLQQGIANAKLGDSLARGLVKALADDRGRLTFDLESEGKLSSPKVEPKVDRVLKNLLRGEGVGDLLQGLFKKL